MRKVEIIKYDSSWATKYSQESARIKNKFNKNLLGIYHFGSTAIPNMPAKPVIDILLVMEDITDQHTINAILTQLNYQPLRRSIIPHVSFFTFREENKLRYHLHIYNAGDPQIQRHLAFFHYLNAHPNERERYAALKIKLAKQFTNDIFQYVKGKDFFVQEIDAKAKHWFQSQAPKYFFIHKSQDWTQEKIMEAMEANLNVHMTHFAQYLPQVELIREPGITIVNSNLPDDTFNFVLDTHLKEAEAAQKIQFVTNYFKNKNLPFSWWLSPTDLPIDLDVHLEASGYKLTEENIAMYIELNHLKQNYRFPAELTIVRALDKKTLLDFAHVLWNDQFSYETYFANIAEIVSEDDPIEYYVGYVEGKPVVRGLSCYYANVVGLHGLSTASSARKRGYATAMQYFRLNRAKDLGYAIAVLQASKEGFPLYSKLGYKDCGIFREFKLP